MYVTNMYTVDLQVWKIFSRINDYCFINDATMMYMYTVHVKS